MWFGIGLGIVAILIIIYFVIYSMCITIVNDYSVLLQRVKRINERYEVIKYVLYECFNNTSIN